MAVELVDAIVRLKRAFDEDRLGHAYLVHGAEPASRLRVAAELLAHINGGPTLGAFTNPDVHLVEPQSKSRRISIEQMRTLEQELSMRRVFGLRKGGVIVDADRLTVQASNAFLKTLEEPPPNSLLILLTASPESLLQTIISRCIPVSLRASLEREWTAEECALLELVAEVSREKKRNEASALRLARRFQVLLERERVTAKERHEAEYKEEESRYRTTSEAGAWLELREDFHAAAAQADYLGRRTALLDVLLAWWAGVLRAANGIATGLPENYLPLLKQLAEAEEVSDLLDRIEALERMRGHLERNIHEGLALDAGFVAAFG